jgi:signal transduction histidine kinase
MRLVQQLKPLLFCLGIFFSLSAHAQSSDSAKRQLAVLLVQRQARLIPDTVYLKAVDSIAPLLAKEDSLPLLLATYREIAFENKKLGRYRADYYTLMAINAFNTNRYGTAIYYSEKNNQERIATGQFEKDGLSHSDLFAVSIYSNNKDFQKVFIKYTALRPILVGLPTAISGGTISAEQVFVALSILQTVVYSAASTGDTARAAEGVGLERDILKAVAPNPAKYGDYSLLYAYLWHTADFEYERSLRHFSQARDLLHQSIRDVLNKEFRAHLQPSYTESLYAEAVDFYFEQEMPDSARSYLDLLRKLGAGKVSFSFLDPGFLADGDSKLLAGTGHFKEAYRQLRKVYQMRDSAFYAVSSDKDNNLYALAEAENTRTELLRSEEEKRTAERSNIFLFFTLTFLIFGGVAGFLVYRSVQQRRLLHLQLDLARNFHDEIGPMLLYAGILVKKESEEHPSPRLEELKSQVSKSMEAVRSMAHDLKSSRLITVTSFARDIIAILEKLRAATSIDYTIKLDNGSKILSYRQATQLNSVVQELISNSVKHADCTAVAMQITAMNHLLKLTWSDNGKGLDPEKFTAGAGTPSGGIGMQNIQERIGTLKGTFRINNDWPKGYSIDITIPMV